jgi:hypothetical protein
VTPVHKPKPLHGEEPLDGPPPVSRRMSRLPWLIATLVVLGLALGAWANDQITMQGERTIYTAGCENGAWQGGRCSGKLVAGERYRFRALKNRREVLFWTLDSSTPSAKFTDCNIADGRNWKCTPRPDPPRTIIRELAAGDPVVDDTPFGLPFHPVAKWKWHLLKSGLWPGSHADS